MNVEVYGNKQELAEAAARDFVERANAAIQETGRFAVALAGGSTPEATYELLATKEFVGEVDWANVHVFFGDERSVPPDDEDSNYKMADDALLSHVSPGSVHRMKGEMLPDEAAMQYEEELREFFETLRVARRSSTLYSSGSATTATPRASSRTPQPST